MSNSGTPEIKDIFTDPRGKPVTLYENTWNIHISTGHPEMTTRYDDLKNTVEDPDHIREGRRPAKEELYVKQFTSDAVFVSTKYLDGESITIVTSSYSGTDRSSRGNIKWRK